MNYNYQYPSMMPQTIMNQPMMQQPIMQQPVYVQQPVYIQQPYYINPIYPTGMYMQGYTLNNPNINYNNQNGGLSEAEQKKIFDNLKQQTNVQQSSSCSIGREFSAMFKEKY